MATQVLDAAKAARKKALRFKQDKLRAEQMARESAASTATGSNLPLLVGGAVGLGVLLLGATLFLRK